MKMESQKISAVFLGLLMVFGTISAGGIEAFAQVEETVPQPEIIPEEIVIEPEEIEILDITPPKFSTISNIVREATSSNGAVVNYATPIAYDENQVVSITCSPVSGSQFPLGTTDVTCIAIDDSENQSQKTFEISIVDTTAPTIQPLQNIEVIAFDFFTELTLERPTVTDIVDSFPVITNDSPSLFPLGETLVTWTAEDDSGNTSTQTQLVTLILEQPEIIGDAEVILEAISFETPSELVEIPIEVKSNLEYELTNDFPEYFDFGENTITWTLVDILDNTATLTQKITFVDTTAPSIKVNLAAISLDKNRDKGTFQVVFDVRDAVDFEPIIEATLNGVPVSNGQYVELKQNEDQKIEDSRGMLKIEDNSFILTVSGTDFSENSATESTSMSLMTYQEIPIEEIVLEELEITDLYTMLDNLETIPPSDLSNLGLELKQLDKIAKIMFEQEKSDLKQIQSDYKELIAQETDKTQKKLLESELKQVKKESRDEFKALQKEYRDIFDQYKAVAKLMLKEKKSLEKNEIENEFGLMDSSLQNLESDRESEIQVEQEQEDNQKEIVTNEIFERILDRVTLMDSYDYAKDNFDQIYSLKSDMMTSKDKQKMIQEILKDSDKSLKNEFKEIIKDVKKEQKELKKSLDLQEKELKQKEKELKKLEKQQAKLTKLQEKELEKLEKEMKKLEEKKQKQLADEAKKAEKAAIKQQKQLQKELEQQSKEVQKQVDKDSKKAEKEAKKEAKKAQKEAKKAEKEAKKDAKKAEKDSKK